MEGAFEFKMRVMLSLNRSLPYGTTGPDVDFFEAAFEGDIPRLKGKRKARPSTSPTLYVIGLLSAGALRRPLAPPLRLRACVVLLVLCLFDV